MASEFQELRERLLKLGHCPWDIEPEDEGDPLPEPHCHANRDGDCTFAYCPQPLLKQAANLAKQPAPAPEAEKPSERERLLGALKDHWLFQIECHHEAKTDQAVCSCGLKSPEMPNVGSAVKWWGEHLHTKIRGVLPPREHVHTNACHIEGCDRDGITPQGVGAWDAPAEADKGRAPAISDEQIICVKLDAICAHLNHPNQSQSTDVMTAVKLTEDAAEWARLHIERRGKENDELREQAVQLAAAQFSAPAAAPASQQHGLTKEQIMDAEIEWQKDPQGISRYAFVANWLNASIASAEREAEPRRIREVILHNPKEAIESCFPGDEEDFVFRRDSAIAFCNEFVAAALRTGIKAALKEAQVAIQDQLKGCPVQRVPCHSADLMAIRAIDQEVLAQGIEKGT